MSVPGRPFARAAGESLRVLQPPQSQVAAAIVDDEGRVLGIINRLRFLARYAQRHVPELFGRHSR